jgi:hypothetical protein
MAQQSPSAHQWYTPADCAALLGGMPHGDTYRARCPVHGGENPQALSIRLGTDRRGNPVTRLHCFAHNCDVRDICQAMGLTLSNLFSVHTITADHTDQTLPPAQSPRIARLQQMQEPTADDIAQVLLEEMIVSDPAFIQACAPARQKLWELAQASPKARAHFTKAFEHAHISPWEFWRRLAEEHDD